MATYPTPGVYIEEISTFPPSVAEVSTAVPAFIGYTEFGPAENEAPRVLRINTLLEFQVAFGAARPSKFNVDASFDSNSKQWTVLEPKREPENDKNHFTLYDCLNLYFKNGGGSCYIVSIGKYDDTLEKEKFLDGLKALEKEDEPTLIIFPDALGLTTAQDYYDICVEALAQCNKLKDRFTILDVPESQDKDDFRSGIVSDYLKYGAAYYPYLITSLAYTYLETDVSVNIKRDNAASWVSNFDQDNNGITVSFVGSDTDEPKVKIVSGATADEVVFEINGLVLTIRNVDGKTGVDIVQAWQAWADKNDTVGFSISQNSDGAGNVSNTNSKNVSLSRVETGSGSKKNLVAFKNTETALYNQVKKKLADQRITLPPSAAIAGVYARVDRDRGVWKAPANVSLASVISPAQRITDEEQGLLNIDTTAGKSINAIRGFTGKGTLVWGARTLAGNDNDWRFIPVCRLFINAEESIKKATAFAVFEPNDATTWLKVKAMIESYLFGLWERGALAGSTPEAAYFVNVGLGKTMTPQDVLEGRMNVEIGIAAVRPAEFIILKFTHKLQEA